ncbi:MAG: hypothetical protein IJQ59_01160 [Bacteroidaceae bacterium]|nr:hypothetical protein [Bacteroidaceae bacterium]
MHRLLRWECNYPARPREFCERIARLPLREDLAYKCDYWNIREVVRALQGELKLNEKTMLNLNQP